MVDHSNVSDECSRAEISSIGDIDKLGLLDYETNVGVKYNKIATQTILEEQRERFDPH